MGSGFRALSAGVALHDEAPESGETNKKNRRALCASLAFHDVGPFEPSQALPTIRAREAGSEMSFSTGILGPGSLRPLPVAKIEVPGLFGPSFAC